MTDTKKEFNREDIKQNTDKIQNIDIPDTLEFDGEFYFELIDVDGKKLEHV
jgi:hypothetical protein